MRRKWKLTQMTNDEECLKELSLFKNVPKIHLLGQKWHFLGLGKRPKTTVESEVKPNLLKNKWLLGFLHQIIYKLFSSSETKKVTKCLRFAIDQN